MMDSFLVAAFVGAVLFPAQGGPGAPDSVFNPQARELSSPAITGRIDGRVRLLAKELDLDAGQQAEVRRLLELQKLRIQRVWADEVLPPARRVIATQAISDATADSIRALLSEEQRKKYIKPRKRDGQDGTPPDVERWMAPGSKAQ